MSDRLRIIVFFLLIFGLLFFLGRAGLPLAHVWLDPVAIRDTGTMFSYLVSRPDPLRSLVMATLQHGEGPLQYLMLNTYALAVGDLFRLNPTTMQFPNTVLAFLTALFAFALCRKFFSLSMACYGALAFALGPWLAFTIRLPEYWNTISCLLHFSTMYFFACLMKEPESQFYKIAAPVSLMLYISSGLDWPCYLFCLFVFFVMSGRFSSLVKNPFNILPALAILFLIVWSIALIIKFGEEGIRTSRLVYPFWRLAICTQESNTEAVWEHTLLPWGPQMALAFAGFGIYLSDYRKRLLSDKVSRGLLDSMCVWLVLATPPVLVSSGSPQYLYVLAMPSALLTAVVLSRIRTHYGLGLAFIMLFAQFYFVTDGSFRFENDEKRRILAAACFLIEQRPDLLASDKKPFASGALAAAKWKGNAGAVTSYMRGESKSLVMPYEFPATRYGTLHPAPLDAFVSEYNNEGKIGADWIILGSEALSDENPGRDFFRRFLNDPNVRWIARFREYPGREIYIGEISNGSGLPADQAPLMDVKSLSDRYVAKYDRMSFLKRNMEYIWHY